MSTTETDGPSLRPWWLLLIVLGIVFVADLQSVSFDFVTWDDPLHVLENPLLTAPSTISLTDHFLTPWFGYPIPVTVLSYRLDYLLFGLEPGGFHFTNVALHVLAVALVFAIGRRLGLTLWISAGAALLFGLHPVTVEPVAWVTGRKDLLATTFALAAFWFFLGSSRWLERSARDPDASVRSKPWMLWLAGACYAGSLLSKPSALGLGILVVFIVLVAKPHRRRGLVLGGAMLGSAAVVSVLTRLFLQDIGAVTASVTPLDRLANLANASYLYLQNVILPLDLRVKYDLPFEGVAAPFPTMRFALVCLVLVGLLMLAWRRSSRGSALGIGALWILVTIAPVSGIVPSPRYASDSYLYLVLPGVCWAAAAMMQSLASRRPRLGRAAMVVACAALVALVPIRVSTADKWRDSVRLWETTFRLYPDSPQVCRNWGVAHMFGRVYAATPEESTRRAAAIFQGCIETLGHREMFVGNLGVLHFQLGNLDQSRGYFLEALAYDPEDTRARTYLQTLGAP